MARYGDDAVMGDYVLGDDDEHVQVPARLLRQRLNPRAGAPRRLALPPRPSWRDAVAPGVNTPDAEGLEFLPMTGNPGNTFTSASTLITFGGFPQKPFRAERLLCSVARSAGAAGILVLCQGIFVGADLMQLELGGFDIELLGRPDAFNTRLRLVQATPGIQIRMPCVTSIAVPVGESVTVSIMWTGSNVR